MGIDLGNRIRETFERPSAELINQFAGIPSSNVGDMMNRLFCMNGSIKAMSKHALLGPAFTVKVREGDNVFLHLAIELAQPGDIIVVDSAGCESRSLMGEMMFTYAQAKGIGGFVLDGAIRDQESLEHLNIPVYARAITPQGPLKNGYGEINFPIACGGQVVMPGDIIIGDQDGICVVPQHDAYKVYAAAQEKFRGEQEKLERYAQGYIPGSDHASGYMKIAEKIETNFIK